MGRLRAVTPWCEGPYLRCHVKRSSFRVAPDPVRYCDAGYQRWDTVCEEREDRSGSQKNGNESPLVVEVRAGWTGQRLCCPSCPASLKSLTRTSGCILPWSPEKTAGTTGHLPSMDMATGPHAGAPPMQTGHRPPSSSVLGKWKAS